MNPRDDRDIGQRPIDLSEELGDVDASLLEDEDALDDVWNGTCDRQPDDPTPEEIRQACLHIQANWTEEERRFRAGIRDHGWGSFLT